MKTLERLNYVFVIHCVDANAFSATHKTQSPPPVVAETRIQGVLLRADGQQVTNPGYGFGLANRVSWIVPSNVGLGVDLGLI